uniref:SLC12 domain-containing protein n=1 Tax=Steinernema glaseri TaxID=37863 RepID=A0A1I7Y6P6_9BILA
MDSLPPTFCLDVMGNLDLKWEKYGELAKALTGRWHAAARSFTENIHELQLLCKVYNGKWSYIAAFRERRDDRSDEEILAMNDRYIRCHFIYINTSSEGIEYYNSCPKEEILNEVIPRVIPQLRPSSRIFFQHNICALSRKDADLFYHSLLDSSGFGIRCFGALALTYYGPESLYFLAILLTRGCNFEGLLLASGWPHSTAMEDLIVKFMCPRPRITFYIHSPEGAESQPTLKLTPRIMQAIVNAWDKADSYLYVCTPRYTGLEEVLSVPVPPNVNRRLLKAKYKNKYFIIWSKDSGSTLSCTLNYAEHKISFNSPANERVYDRNNMCL